MAQEWVQNCTPRHWEHILSIANGTTVTCEDSRIVLSSLFGAANLLPLLLFIPFYDRCIYPCLSGWKWFSMLSRMAVGNVFIVASVVAAIVIEGARMEMLSAAIRTNETVLINAFGFNQHTTTYNVASPLSVLYISIPFFFFVFAELFSNVTGKHPKPLPSHTPLGGFFALAAVEFIYAQSPGNMKGLLIGLLFASEGISMGLSALVTLTLSEASPQNHFCSFFGNKRMYYKEVLDTWSPCRAKLQDSIFGCVDGILFAYMILGGIAVMSAVVFAVAALRYKPRRRDSDPYMPLWLIPDDKETAMHSIIRKCCC